MRGPRKRREARGCIAAVTVAVTLAAAPLAYGAPRPAAGASDAERAARALLARPKGSISLGGTTGGRLLGARSLPLKGEGYAVFPAFAARDTHYGTEELIDAIRRAAKEVHQRFPDAILGVGNLGYKEGGKIPWSVSHQAGRDADLGMYARDASGRPVELGQFVKFGPDGRDSSGRYRFDTARNLALVEALVRDGSSVQYIFVADWLKQLLLDEAVKSGTSPELRERLTQVLHQPTDSNPHADHFHIRVFCSVEDRQEGCLNRGPERAWVALGDDAWRARVDALARLIGSDCGTRTTVQLITRVGELDGTPALPALFDALADRRDAVRRAALRAIRGLRDADTVAGLLSALKKVEDPRWAGELFDAVLAANDPHSVETALVAVRAPAELLHAKALPRAGDALRRTACAILGRFGRESAVPPLLALLEASSAEVRVAAHDALRRVTNQAISDRGLESRSAKHRTKVIAAWRGFWERDGEAGWLQWQRQGFEARGFRFPGRMASRGGVDVLIRAIGHRDRVVSDNAVHVLSALTGHEVDPRWRTPRNNARHWRSWWAEHGTDVDLP